MSVYTYIRAAPTLAVEHPLTFGQFKLRTFPQTEANHLQIALEKRNVFSRHARGRDRYAQKASRLAGSCVLYLMDSDAGAQVDQTRLVAACAEALILICRAFAERRQALHRYISLEATANAGTDLWIAQHASQLSTKNSTPRHSEPVPITKRDEKRFMDLGVGSHVLSQSGDPTFLGDRIRKVCDWLLLSRLDPNSGSAYIKTGTAAESLIAGDRQGQVTRRLSTRLALLTAKDEPECREITQLVTTLYGTRCDFTHGRTRGEASEAEQKRLEVFDRLTLLGLSALAANGADLTNPHDVDLWFDAMRGRPTIRRPFPQRFVDNALKLAGLR
jgi:hypothetical protein